MSSVIIFDDVWFRYSSRGEWILKGICFKVPYRSITCILGVNGSGKSTLLKIMAGIYIPQRGVVRIFDITLNKKTSNIIRDFVGLVLQDPDTQLLMPTVQEELILPLVLRGVPKDKAISKARAIAYALGIINLLDKKVDELSYGQKKRVTIASSLVHDPKLLLLDEPTLGLDPMACFEIMEFVSKLPKRNITVVFTTQDIDIAALYADYVIILKDGKVVAEGPRDDILRKPETMRNVCGLRLTRIGHLFELASRRNLLKFDKLPLTISEALKTLEKLLRNGTS